ncbi:MAG: hypothetical protein ACK5GU_11890, partial [Chloroflexota bacterium]
MQSPALFRNAFTSNYRLYDSILRRQIRYITYIAGAARDAPPNIPTHHPRRNAMRPGMRRVMVGGHRDAPGVMGGDDG